MTADKRKRQEAGVREREQQHARQLEHLEAEAMLHRNRLALYNQRILTGKPSSHMRLEELRRISDGADARLAHAKLEH